MSTFLAGETLTAAELELWVQGQTLDTLVISTVATYYNSQAEALITSANVAADLLAGHRYRIWYNAPVACATPGAGYTSMVRVRKTNVAGTQLGQCQTPLTINSATLNAVGYADYDCAADESATFVLTAAKSLGGAFNTAVTVVAGYPLTMSLHDVTAGTIPRTI